MRAGRMSRRTAIAGLLAAASTACSRAAFFAVNLPAAFGPYTRHADLRYAPGPAHGVDVYVPANRPDAAPLVVFFYGGRWTDGDKSDYRFVGAALAGLGYVAMLPNYRHFPEVRMAGFMQDAALAVQWAVEHGAEFGADPRRLYLMGHSAGAHMAALVTLDSRYLIATGKPVPPIAGVIGLSGPYDFLPLTDDDVKEMFGPPDNYPNSQPIHFVHAGAPPMLLIHGLADDTVLPKNSINFATALRANGDTVTLKLYPKLKHADTVAAMSIPARSRAPTLADIAAFVGPSVRPRPSS